MMKMENGKHRFFATNEKQKTLFFVANGSKQNTRNAICLLQMENGKRCLIDANASKWKWN
jgi:hypothetical protein